MICPICEFDKPCLEAKSKDGREICTACRDVQSNTKIAEMNKRIDADAE